MEGTKGGEEKEKGVKNEKRKYTETEEEKEDQG